MNDGVGGVPVEEATAKDFISVRAALVKRLGGANEALVWTRIDFRATSAKHAHETPDGSLWWAASYEMIADEVGLTRQQVRGALKTLIEGGFLRSEKHHGANQIVSYSPVFAQRLDSTSGTAEAFSPVEINLSSGSVQPATVLKSTSAPSIEDIKKSTKKVATVVAPSIGAKFALPLCEVLIGELRRNEVKFPDPVPKRWLDDARLMVDRDERDPHQAKALIEWACRDPFWRGNILSMPTFRKQYDRLRLNAGRAVKSSMVEHGREVDEELRRREAERDGRSVSA
jgi:hypothetical protein